MKCAIFEEHLSSCVVYFQFSGTLFPVSMIDADICNFQNCRFRTGTLTKLTVCSLGSLLNCLGQYLDRFETM